MWLRQDQPGTWGSTAQDQAPGWRTPLSQQRGDALVPTKPLRSTGVQATPAPAFCSSCFCRDKYSLVGSSICWPTRNGNIGEKNNKQNKKKMPPRKLPESVFRSSDDTFILPAAFSVAQSLSKSFGTWYLKILFIISWGERRDNIAGRGSESGLRLLLSAKFTARGRKEA